MNYACMSQAEGEALATVPADVGANMMRVAGRTSPRWSIVWLVARWEMFGRPELDGGSCTKCLRHAHRLIRHHNRIDTWCPACCREEV